MSLFWHFDHFTYVPFNNKINGSAMIKGKSARIKIWKHTLNIKKNCDLFSIDEKLKQRLHSGDTQANESFDNQISYLVPKIMNFSQPKCLSYWLALYICFHNEGYLKTWKHIYSLLVITIATKLAMNLKNCVLKNCERKNIQAQPTIKGNESTSQMLRS